MGQGGEKERGKEIWKKMDSRALQPQLRTRLMTSQVANLGCMLVG